MNVKVKLNHKNIAYVKKLANQALVETANNVKSDLQQSQTMPFYKGELQNRSTFVDDSKKNSEKVSIVSDTPYARRLYFHPEYNFNQDKNAKAGAIWFDPYINGNKKTYVKRTFAKIMKGKL